MRGCILACLETVSVLIIFIVSTLYKTLHLLTISAARKWVHISCGFSALVFLPFFEDTLIGRFWGTSCGFSYSITFYIFGSGKIKGFITNFLITSVCRSQNASEMRRGPMIYCVSMSLMIFILEDLSTFNNWINDNDNRGWAC